MPADLTPKPPRTGDGLLELIARPIFGAGLAWEVVESTWPATGEAFDRFSVRRVSGYGDEDVHRILADQGVIHNERKVRAVVSAARFVGARGRTHGSARKWLDSYPDHEARLRALIEIPGVGPWGAYYVAAKCGYSVPAWTG